MTSAFFALRPFLSEERRHASTGDISTDYVDYLSRVWTPARAAAAAAANVICVSSKEGERMGSRAASACVATRGCEAARCSVLHLHSSLRPAQGDSEERRDVECKRNRDNRKKRHSRVSVADQLLETETATSVRRDVCRQRLPFGMRMRFRETQPGIRGQRRG